LPLPPPPPPPLVAHPGQGFVAFSRIVEFFGGITSSVVFATY